MTIVHLTPATTIANTGTVFGAGGDADLSQRDGSDTTLVILATGEAVSFTLSDLSLPSGALLLFCQAQVRALGNALMTCTITASSMTNGYTQSQHAIQSSTLAGFGLTSSFEITDSALDGAALTFACDSGWPPIGLYLAESSLRVWYVTQPATDVVYPRADISPLEEDNRPAITWTNTLDSLGGPQAYVQIRIFTDAQYGAGGFDPDTSTAYVEHEEFAGAVFGTTGAWQLEEPLPDDIYRAYVRVGQHVGSEWLYSEWNYEQFEIDVPTPADPSVLATPDVDEGRVILEWTDVAGDATTDGIQIQRSDGGGDWVPVRLPDSTDSTPGSGDEGFLAEGGDVSETGDTVWDYEAPGGVALTYRFRAWHAFSLTFSYSDWVETSTTLNPSSWWLKHPTRPALNQAVSLRSFATQARAVRQSIQQPLGREDAVVVSDSRGPETGTIVFEADDDDTRDYLKAIAGPSVPLLLAASETDHEPDRWILLGDEEFSRLVDSGTFTHRNATYSFTVVKRPAGLIEAWV